MITYGKAQPSNKAMMLLEHIVVGTVSSISHQYQYLGQRTTYLRIHGKALKTEMMMKTLVMMPLAMTAGCWTAR
jgi:hypothetical protein